MPLLQRKTNRKHVTKGGQAKRYKKFVVNLPPALVQEMGWDVADLHLEVATVELGPVRGIMLVARDA